MKVLFILFVKNNYIIYNQFGGIYYEKIIGILLALTLIIPVFGQVKSNVSTKTIQGVRCNVCELTLDETSEIHVAKGKNALMGAENFMKL